MSEHRASLTWQRGASEFTYDTYSRDHAWEFDAGVRVEASAAADFLGDPARVDPEQAFVAAVASCHMLTFLAIAARKRLTIDAYRDSAIGHMEKNADGKLAITRIVLRPQITWAGTTPDPGDVEKMHELSHEQCFIANSIRTDVRVESA